MNKRMLRFLSLLTVVLSLLMFATLTQAENQSPANNPLKASTPLCYIYQVTIKGSASGNAFNRTGIFAFYSGSITSTTTNGKNPYEIWIVSGNPAAQPSRGAIRFTSNTYFIGSSSILSKAKVDMVFMSVSNGVLTAKVDPSLSSLNANYFTTGNSITSLLQIIRNGNVQMKFNSTGSKVSGAINVGDTVNHGTISANFTGNFIGTTSASNCKFSNV